MENAVNSVILFPYQIISWDIENNKSLKLFQIYNFFDFIDQIVSKIKLHESLKILKSSKLWNLIVFQAQLCQVVKLTDALNPLDPILAKI